VKPDGGSELLPLDLPSDGKKGSALLIHGYTGYPGELYHLAKRLHKAGLAVSVPRLPGHGTDRRDFMATGRRDWLRRALDAYRDLAVRYGEVAIVGHSMGTLLAILVAAEFQPKSVVLLAPALDFADRRLPWTRCLGLFVPVIRTGSPPPPEDAAGVRLALHREYRSDLLVSQARQLVLLRAMAMRALPAVRSDILAILGSRDSSVRATALGILRERARGAAGVRTEVMPDAGHLLQHSPPTRERCADLVLEWLAR